MPMPMASASSALGVTLVDVARALDAVADAHRARVVGVRALRAWCARARRRGRARAAWAWRDDAATRAATNAWRRETIRARRVRAFTSRTTRARARRVVETAFVAWRDVVWARARRLERGIQATKFIRWRVRTAARRRDAAEFARAVSHDDARVTCGAFVRWCGFVAEGRERARELARAAAFHRKLTRASAFDAWRARAARTRSANVDRLARAWRSWLMLRDRARRLEAMATAHTDALAVTFRDAYLLPSAFQTWAAFAARNHRRYAAMEFAEKSRARRALHAWRAAMDDARASTPLEDTTNSPAASPARTPTRASTSAPIVS